MRLCVAVCLAVCLSTFVALVCICVLEDIWTGGWDRQKQQAVKSARSVLLFLFLPNSTLKTSEWNQNISCVLNQTNYWVWIGGVEWMLYPIHQSHHIIRWLISMWCREDMIEICFVYFMHVLHLWWAKSFFVKSHNEPTTSSMRGKMVLWCI